MSVKYVMTRIAKPYKLACVAIIALGLSSVTLFVFAKKTGYHRGDIDLNNAGTPNHGPKSRDVSMQSPSDPRQNCTLVADAASNHDKIVVFRGVGFNYDEIIATQVKTERVSASPLENETDKPDQVAPEHLSFTFIGPYAARHKSSFFTPQLHVYVISEYKEALSKSTIYVQQLEKEVWHLKSLLAERPESIEKEIPFLPFGIDAIQSFRARVSYIDFRNGKGIAFLTQYNIEPSLINNNGLVYVFQGLTDDGQYYLSATFPVFTPTLVSGVGTKDVDAYRLPAYFYDGNYDLNMRTYRHYLTEIKSRLEKLSPDKFKPNLTLFEKLIGSVCIN